MAIGGSKRDRHRLASDSLSGKPYGVLLPILIPLLYALAVSLYFLYRNYGRWAESDSAGFSLFINSVSQSGRLIPTDSSNVYPNGYAFQAISTFILAICHITVTNLQQIVYPLLVPLVVLPAWLMYRELIGSARAATIAVTLLFMQPEFLFVVLRSSHEKITRSLLFFCVYWLLRGLRLRGSLFRSATSILLFYLTALAMISTNNLVGQSFTAALLAAFAIGIFIARLRSHLIVVIDRSFKRIIYTILTLSLLGFIFTFYLYEPAIQDISFIQGIVSQVSALFLDFNHTHASANSYSQVAGAWVSLPVYFAVSVADWLILVLSLAVWAGQGWNWVVRGNSPRTSAVWYLWLLYSAFMLQGLISAIVDISGAVGNLQQRIFPSISIFAVALVSQALFELRPSKALLLRRVVNVALVCIVSGMAVLSILKATDDPQVSNKWIFYRPAEQGAMDWSESHLTGEQIWAGADERLATVYETLRGNSLNGNYITGFWLQPFMRTMIVSDVMQQQSTRTGIPLKIPYDASQVYDNGEAQVLRLRATTPFQK
jgi:hypothetical protein